MPTTGTVDAAAGVISMVLLTAAVVLGVLLDRRVRLPGLSRFAGLSLHRWVSLLAVSFLAVHIGLAVTGARGLGFAAIVVPAISWIGLGAVATDLVIVLVVTSLLRRHLSRRTWRLIHWLAYACWPAAIAHSFLGGMRSGRLLDLAVACAVIAVAAAGWRVAARLRSGPAASPVPSGRLRPPVHNPRPGDSGLRLSVNPIACTGHGLCAELLPELVALDQWGYPLLADIPVPVSLTGRARRTVTDCPALALRLTRSGSRGQGYADRVTRAG